MSRYTVRSTAVSGAGLVLSVGAGVFLIVWWARHWHRTRRSARLVDHRHSHRATTRGSRLGCGAMAVRIVTDSSCDLTDEEVAAHGIEVVPLSIRFGDDEYEDRSELSVESFYAKLAASAVLPETAAPAPGQVRGRLPAPAARPAPTRSCASTFVRPVRHDAVGAERRQGRSRASLDVRVVDSRSITSGLGTQVLLAAEAAAGGASADEVVALVEDLAARTHVFGALDTLDNLKKGGRIGGAQALLGSLLSIKPIVDISTGKVEEAGKARTRKKALEVLRDKVAEAGAIEHLCVHPRLRPGRRPRCSTSSPRSYPRDQIRVGHIGPVIGTHGGPRVMGVTWIAATLIASTERGLSRQRPRVASARCVDPHAAPRHARDRRPGPSTPRRGGSVARRALPARGAGRLGRDGAGLAGHRRGPAPPGRGEAAPPAPRRRRQLRRCGSARRRWPPPGSPTRGSCRSTTPARRPAPRRS